MILITNDDGYESMNLHCLYDIAKTIDDEVKMVVSLENQSGVGNCSSSTKRIHSQKIDEGYIINGTPVDCIRYGLSKFERICENISHKLQVQENITEEIADFLEKELKPKGVIVVIKNSRHMCMEMRGVKSNNTNVTTSAIRGEFINNPKLKDEFLNIIGD